MVVAWPPASLAARALLSGRGRTTGWQEGGGGGKELWRYVVISMAGAADGSPGGGGQEAGAFENGLEDAGSVR